MKWKLRRHSTEIQHITTGLQKDYVAGHWLNLLPNDLLWTVQTPFDSRPSKFQGPSWCWTGVNGVVTFNNALKDADLNGFRAITTTLDPYLHPPTRVRKRFHLLRIVGILKKDELRPEAILPPLPPRPHWDIVDLKTILVDDKAPFGAVKEAVLTIKALSQSFDVRSIHRVDQDSAYTTLELHASTSSVPKEYSITFWPDCLDLERPYWKVESAIPLTLVVLGWKSGENSKYYLQGLVLEPLQRSSETTVKRFRRCGVFCVRHRNESRAHKKELWTGMLGFYAGFTEEILEIV